MAAYRAGRRAAGKDHPRTPRQVDTDGHIGRDWFRRNVWLKALDIAQLGFHVTPNHLRHARVLAAGRGFRHPSGQGASWPWQHYDHRAVPAHLSAEGGRGPQSTRQDSTKEDCVGVMSTDTAEPTAGRLLDLVAPLTYRRHLTTSTCSAAFSLDDSRVASVRSARWGRAARRTRRRRP